MRRKTALIDPLLKRALVNPFAALDCPWRDPAFPLAAAKQLWKTIHTEALPKWIEHHPFTRPWGFYLFDLKLAGPPSNEKDYLIAHDLLTPAEEKLLTERTTHENPQLH